jgi:hypothetical protein
LPVWLPRTRPPGYAPGVGPCREGGTIARGPFGRLAIRHAFDRTTVKTSFDFRTSVSATTTGGSAMRGEQGRRDAGVDAVESDPGRALGDRSRRPAGRRIQGGRDGAQDRGCAYAAPSGFDGAVAPDGPSAAGAHNDRYASNGVVWAGRVGRPTPGAAAPVPLRREAPWDAVSTPLARRAFACRACWAVAPLRGDEDSARFAKMSCAARWVRGAGREGLI